MPQEEKHGIVTDTGTVEDLGSDANGSVPLGTVLRAVVDTPLSELPEPAIVKGVEVLTQGAVAGALLFICLSFIFPDRITTALGILVPIITLLLQHKLAKKKAE